MDKTATVQVRARVPAGRVKKVQGILDKFGVDTTAVINMLFAKIEREKRPPVELISRDPETEELLADRDFVETLRRYKAGELKIIRHNVAQHR